MCTRHACMRMAEGCVLTGARSVRSKVLLCVGVAANGPTCLFDRSLCDGHMPRRRHVLAGGRTGDVAGSGGVGIGVLGVRHRRGQAVRRGALPPHRPRAGEHGQPAAQPRAQRPRAAARRGGDARLVRAGHVARAAEQEAVRVALDELQGLAPAHGLHAHAVAPQELPADLARGVIEELMKQLGREQVLLGALDKIGLPERVRELLPEVVVSARPVLPAGDPLDGRRELVDVEALSSARRRFECTR